MNKLLKLFQFNSFVFAVSLTKLFQIDIIKQTDDNLKIWVFIKFLINLCTDILMKRVATSLWEQLCQMLRSQLVKPVVILSLSMLLSLNVWCPKDCVS